MTLADEINRMVRSILEASTWTSAGGKNPVENFIKEFRGEQTPSLETEVKTGAGKEIKEQKKTREIIKKVDRWDKGHIGKVNSFTSTQFGNLQGFVENPAGFIINQIFKKFAKGVGIIALALIIFEAVKWIISELLKPGRLLDLRFKRDINKEIIAFRRREDQQKLKQGFSSIIITSSPRLRASVSQAAQTTNTLDFVARGGFPENIGSNPMLVEAAAGQSLSKNKGKSRGASRYNR